MTTLGSLLVQNRIVGVVEIEKALQRQVIMGGDLATNLLELSLVKEDALAKYTAKAFGMPLLDRNLLMQPEARVVKMMPWEAANQHRIVPITIEGDKMIVATSQPMQEHALEEVGFLLGVDFDPRFVLEFRLAIALNRYFGIEIPGRMTKLQKKLAPETMELVAPIVPPPGMEIGIVSGEDPRTKEPLPPADEPATRPADPDYVETVGKTAEVDRIQMPSSAPSSKEEESAAPEDKAQAAPPEPDTAQDDAPGIEAVVAAAQDAVPMDDVAAAAADDAAPAVEKPSEAPPSEPSAQPSLAPKKKLDLEAVAEDLLKVTHRNEILHVLMENTSSAFEFAVLFVIHGKDAEAHLKTLPDGTVEKVDNLILTVDSGGMLEIAYTTRSFYLGQVGNNDTDRLLLAELDRPKPRNCAIIPISLRNRVVMLLYGDNGKKGVKATHMADLSQLGRLVSDAFERLLLEKKYGQYRAQVSMMPSKPAHAAFSRIPSGRLSDIPPGAAGLYRIVGNDNSGKMRTSMVAGGPADGRDRDSAMTPQQMAQMASLVKSLAPGGGPLFSSIPHRPAAELAFEEDSGVRAEKIISLAPGDKPQSVVVNMREEIDRLVTRIISSKKYDKVAVEVLVGIGDDAVRRLVEHFPGPLLYDRYQETNKLPKVGRHGYLLKAITKFGKMAVPYLLPLLSSRDTDVRFYATFMFSELKFPEVLEVLTDRLFDPDRHIRAMAVDVMRGFIAHIEYRWAVQRIVEVMQSSERDLESKYLAAEALGNLGEPLALEPLVALLSSADEKLVKITHRALIKIALFDHGFTEKRWLDWYHENKHRNRLEWAIEGLTNEDSDIRELAYMALKFRIDDIIEETPAPSTFREFKELNERLTLWWQEEGREIHQLTEGT